MSTTLSARPVNEPDLLTLLADEHTVTRKPLADMFRAACRTVAVEHDGWVDPNLVRARVLEDFAAGLVECDDPELNHRQYSALWSPACGPNGFLDKTDRLVPINPTHSRGNGNKDVRYRRWRGWSDTA